MTDPLDALRVPATPVAPDPTFARSLRARIERALLDPPEVPTTVTDVPPTTRPRSLTPYLAVVDARAAVEFYVTAFGATHRGEPIVMPDGRVGHVEVAVGDSVLMLADGFPEMGLVAPRTRGGVSQSAVVEVADPDAVVGRAVAAGGTLDRPVADHPHGRNGVVLDTVRTPMDGDGGDPARPARRRGLRLPMDPRRRSRRTLLPHRSRVGDRARPRRDGRRVRDQGLGIFGGQPRGGMFLCFSVPDVDAAAAVVRAAGGTATEPQDRPYGRLVDCVDDQGMRFAVVG